MPSSMANRGDFTSGPFRNTKGDYNFTLSRSSFTPGISIKLVPLKDLSKNGDPGYSELDKLLGKLRYYFKPGDRVRGMLVNSHITGKEKTILGRIHKIIPDYNDNTIRILIKNPKNLKIQEIYVNSMEKIYEANSYWALSFSEFINS
jgi:hypothetical protein